MKPYLRIHLGNFVNVIRIPQKMFFEKNNIAKICWEVDCNYS